MASAQEVEMLRRQLDELAAQMIEICQQSPSTAMNAAVTGLTEAVRTMGQSVSKPRPEDMRVGKPEPYAPGKDCDDWDFTFNGYAGTLDPAYFALLKSARQSPTVVMATPPNDFAVLTHDAHTERSTESREESWKQRFRSLQTTVLDVWNVRSGRQHGTVRANYDVQVRFQDPRRGRPSERIPGTGGRYDEANGTDPVPDDKKSVHYLEHARASEDTSSAECGQAVKFQRITRGG